MTVLALDTDVLVSWTIRGALRHDEARRLLAREVGGHGQRVGLAAQVLYEWVHVVTDSRRFTDPLSMADALSLADDLWSAPETERIPADAGVPGRTFDLLRRHRLGRKRILDTALAATLESAGIHRLATWNVRDFAAFGFLEIVDQ